MGIARGIATTTILAIAGIGPLHAGAAGAAPLPATVAKPATVINHSCGPRTDPNKLTRVGDHTHVTYGSARIALRGGFKTRTSHTIYFWAKISGASKGNTVWLDWADASNLPPASWHQCGPYTVRSGHDQHTLAVNFVWGTGDKQRWFRACGHHAGKTKCTHWGN